jgi:hypothetical protein
MRRARLTTGTVVAILMAVGVVAAQAEPQFAGTWVLDPAQSQLPTHSRKHSDALAERPDIKLVVEQQGHLLKATRTVAKGNRERSLSETFVADGTDQTHAARHGTVVTRAVFDGDRLVVTGTYAMKGERGDKTTSRQSIWTLSPDRTVLTIETTLETPSGERTRKSVYIRS